MKLERDYVVLKEKDSCAKIENESLKQKCLSLEKEINSFKNQVLICQKDNNILQEQISIFKKEQNISKEKNLYFENKNQVLELFSKEQDSKFSNLKKGCTLKSFDKSHVSKNKFSKGKSFQSKNSFSHGFSKKNNFSEKPILKQSLFDKNISKRKNVFKKKNFVSTSSYVHKHFSNLNVKSDVFECSKCVCFHCNKNGHFSYSCPFKNSSHFETKFVWVPKTNPKGPNIKRVPNIT